MLDEKDGGSAFPTEIRPGMTLRDWYIGEVLKGLLAGSDHPLLKDNKGVSFRILENQWHFQIYKRFI